MASGITVNVYEPTGEAVDKILTLQEKWVDADDPNARTVTGVEIIKELFPLLTDLEGIEDMSDDEIQEVADNPTVAYIQLQIEIETILTEIYKTHVLSARKNLLETDYHVEANKVNVEAFNRSVALAVKNTGTTDLIEKIDKFAEASAQAAEVEEKVSEEKRIIHLDQIRKETEIEVDKTKEYNEKYAKYMLDFAEQDNKELTDLDGERD